MAKLVNVTKLGRLIEIASESAGVGSNCPRLEGSPECELKASADKAMAAVLPCNAGADYHTCSVYRVVAEGSLA